MKTFYQILGNTLISGITTFFIWSSVVYWAYLETGSVLATSILSGIYLVLVAVSGFWFGSIVDHNTKRASMFISSIGTLVLFSLALVVYTLAPENAFESIKSVHLWSVAVILLLGVIAGNIRNIALPTIVTLLVPESDRARANGMTGTVMGASFMVSSAAAGFGLGFFGMKWVLVSGIVLTLVSIIHLLFVRIPEEKEVAHTDEKKSKNIDLKGTIAAIKSVPGLFPLIFFATFNNFLGGIFSAIMDPYGLSLVSVQVWGTLWGILGVGFIVGGTIIAKRGVGKNPVRTLFNVNLLTWTVCIFMTIQPSIILLAVSIFIYLCAAPFIEASEHTVLQKVVPYERQGRVFGFAQSLELSASPITAFLIGPLAQFFFIPFMTTGRGVELIGSWYGVGPGRGIALVFTVVGIIGLIVTAIMRKSRAAKVLSEKYAESTQA